MKRNSLRSRRLGRLITAALGTISLCATILLIGDTRYFGLAVAANLSFEIPIWVNLALKSHIQMTVKKAHAGVESTTTPQTGRRQTARLLRIKDRYASREESRTRFQIGTDSNFVDDDGSAVSFRIGRAHYTQSTATNNLGKTGHILPIALSETEASIDAPSTALGFFQVRHNKFPQSKGHVRYISQENQVCWFTNHFVVSLSLGVILLMWIYAEIRMPDRLIKAVQHFSKYVQMLLGITLIERCPCLQTVNLLDSNASSFADTDCNCLLSSFEKQSLQSKSSKSKTSSIKSSNRFGWSAILCGVACIYGQSQTCFACIDIGRDLSDYPCFDYDADSAAFNMTCSFAWTYNNTCIILLKYEIFNGNGHTINLTGISNWEGLFRIGDVSNGGPFSLENAPIIHDVHMIGGETNVKGGFIIQSGQKHFIVNNCSSTGVIQGQMATISFGGGGICGHGCSGDILITHCRSSGEIRGLFAGGIAGRDLGYFNDVTHNVTISQSYSTGDIVGQFSGGICGLGTGSNSAGIVTIAQCYSLGEIRGTASGGITGSHTSYSHGHVAVTNCYSRGNITGTHSGGICGLTTGSTCGTVILTNVYASGEIQDADAGGLIGGIAANAKAISITTSVYHGNTGSMIGGEGTGIANSELNSGDLSEITGTVYCYEEDDDGYETKACWDSQAIWKPIENDFPILRTVSAIAPTPTPSPSKIPRAAPSPAPGSCIDVRYKLLAYPCLSYDYDQASFQMTCSFSWKNNEDCIILLKNERFEGNGHSINLIGISNWEGLIRVAESSNGGPSSLKDAPMIHDVHMIGGETSPQGGFIIQSGQKHFIVNHCSSTGGIQGQICPPCLGGGGICGHECSGDILITRCWSSGTIRGYASGGIAGMNLGTNNNAKNTVTISHCYSTGDILGLRSGGICGHGAGANYGMVMIAKCNSLGTIGGRFSGGITGGSTANMTGNVSITDCYSRGLISAEYAGGICGRYTGANGGTVDLSNVYASGAIVNEKAGGIVGHIDENTNGLKVTMSVYSGDTGNMIGSNGAGEQHVHNEKNSGNLTAITGSVYCYSGDKLTCWDESRVWQVVENDFPVLRGSPATPSPLPLPSLAPSTSFIPKETQLSVISATSSSSSSSSSSSTGIATSAATQLEFPTTTPTPSKHSKTPAQNKRVERMELPVQYLTRSVI